MKTPSILRARVPLYLAVFATILAFVGGGLAQWSGVLATYLKPAGAYLLGRKDGCSLSSAYWPLKLSRALTSVRNVSTIVNKTADGLVQWQTPLGLFWSPEKTSALFVVAEQIARTYGDGLYRVHAGDVVLDCGANIGTFTREALLAGASRVVAIEPVPSNVECLRRNFQVEIAAGRVIVVAKGVWHERGHFKMNLYENSALDSFVMSTRSEEPDTVAPRSLELPVDSIDAIVRELQLDRVDFIKMDIEGAERNAIRGARETILKFKPRMALATENLKDDRVAVPEAVHAIDSGYTHVSGPCSVLGAVGHWELRPDSLYFSRP